MFSLAVNRLRACLQAVACRALHETGYHTTYVRLSKAGRKWTS